MDPLTIAIIVAVFTLIVRSSGTESKIRVMGESNNSKLLQKCFKIILKKIK